MTATQTSSPDPDEIDGRHQAHRPPLPTLTPHQQIALLARCLWDEGHNDHLAGHITYKQPDGTFLVNPFGLTWGEVRASDIMRMDADGNELDGPWTITPAIALHVELHKAREDVTVSLHNHTRWGTIWADLGRVPGIYDQSSAYYDGEVAVYDQYWGAVDDVANARAAVEAVGDAGMALLANHGVLVMGNCIEQAYLRAHVWNGAVARPGTSRPSAAGSSCTLTRLPPTAASSVTRTSPASSRPCAACRSARTPRSWSSPDPPAAPDGPAR